MIPVEAAKYLWNARQAADRVARFTAGRGFPDYVQDDMLRAAVERQFEIIGEAFAALRRTHPALAATIPQLPQAIAFRNVLIHGYATLSHRLVWSVIANDLSGLRQLLAHLLDEAPKP